MTVDHLFVKPTALQIHLGTNISKNFGNPHNKKMGLWLRMAKISVFFQMGLDIDNFRNSEMKKWEPKLYRKHSHNLSLWMSSWWKVKLSLVSFETVSTSKSSITPDHLHCWWYNNSRDARDMDEVQNSDESNCLPPKFNKPRKGSYNTWIFDVSITNFENRIKYLCDILVSRSS